MSTSCFAEGVFTSRSMFVRLSLPLILLSISPGCASEAPRTVQESLLQLQQQAQQLDGGGGSAQTAPSAPSSDETPDAEAAATFQVKFETSVGDFVIEVHRDWAPAGAERFYRLVKSGFYDECRFFRVMPDFMVQFGINGDPATQKKWDRNIPDDPALESNQKGYVTFATAGPNTRTTQIFINYKNNKFLDSQGFSPFGKVIEGMSVVESIFSAYGETPEQGQIESRGNEYLNKEFPSLDYVRKASLIEATGK